MADNERIGGSVGRYELEPVFRDGDCVVGSKDGLIGEGEEGDEGAC